MSDILKELFGDNEFADLGRQMSDSVQDALRTGDFSALKTTVNSTLNTVVSRSIPTHPTPPGGKPPVPPLSHTQEQRTAAPGYSQPSSHGETRRTSPQEPGNAYAHYRDRRASRPGARPVQTGGRRYPPSDPSIRAARERAATAARSGMTLYAQNYHRSSRFYVLGLLLLLVGLAGIFAMGISFGASLLSLFSSAFGLGPLLLCGGTGLMLGLSVYAFARGGRTFGLPSRFRTYCQLLEKPRFCEINRLAAALHKSRSSVLWDIEQLRQAGMLPGGRLDEKKTCLMLGDEVYQQYLSAKDRQKEREEIESLKEKEPDGADAVIAEGRSRIRQIREANIALPGEEISSKLDRLEDVTTRIFAYVEKHRNKLPDIRRFMDYYLPTTVKLVTSYREFEAQPVQGKNILSAKQEILEILDTINAAFEKLFDTLYQEDAMDISTDISALKAVLAQEGLSQKDFNAGA
ncbi:MAG: hypothetical protein HFG26_02105 [Provencibacterium sp.]|nr:hypothetical protein [Provencibacterium sp.]